MFEWLPDQIERAYQVFKEFSLDWKFILNQPATETEIQACEVALGISLPPSYREFLLCYNGAKLFCTYEVENPNNAWRDNSGIIIYGTDNLVEFNQQQKQIYIDFDWNSLIVFCDLASIGTGDFCALDPQNQINSEYAVLDCMHDLVIEDWRESKIASSFEQWLTKIFDQVVLYNKQPEYWLEAESSTSFSLAEETPSALIRQGLKKAIKQNYKEAIENFEQILKIDSEYYEAYYERGNIYFALGDYRASIEDYNRAIYLNPLNYVIAYNQRGLARTQLGEYQQAIEDFNQAIKLNSGVAEIYHNRGNARSALGDNQGAMEDFQKAAELLAEEENIYTQEYCDQENESITMVLYADEDEPFIS